jgi:centrosomal protein CEP290
MLCALLQVSDLEEERRKLRLEVKFRAKYHGRAALEMGLSPEQLLLLEEYVEGLKGGQQPEERLVTQLQQRVGVRKSEQPRQLGSV